MKHAFAYATLALALAAATASAAGTKDVEQGLTQAGWRQSAPGVYLRTLPNGEQWEAHVGAEGSRRDRAQLDQDLFLARQQAATARDPAERQALEQQVADLETMRANTLDGNAPYRKESGAEVLTLAAGGTPQTNVLTGHLHNYHEDAIAALCGFNVSVSSDMASDDVGLLRDGFAQGSSAWGPNGGPQTSRLSISGYAKAMTSARTVLKSLGVVSAAIGSSGSTSTPIAETWDADFDCTLVTYMQAAGSCTAPNFLSLSRTKQCSSLP